MFAALPDRPSAVDACESALIQAIVTGELAAGARLPPERQLAERLGVHRVTLRTALSRLATRRLISARQGSGNYVEDWRSSAGLSLLPELTATEDPAAVAADLLLLRRQMARAVLLKLSTSRSESSLNELESAIDALDDCAKRGGDARAIAQADLEVVRCLLTATGSLVLQMCWNPLLSTLDQMPTLRAALYRDPASNVAGWRALLAWLDNPVPSLIDVIIEQIEARDDQTLEALKSCP